VKEVQSLGPEQADGDRAGQVPCHRYRRSEAVRQAA
jgi:hypothetical protein